MMKKIITTSLSVIALSLFASCSKTTDPQKLIIGSWVNPYTYASTGEMKGFKFEKGGKCESINIPSLELEKWEIKDNRLIITGIDVDSETGEKSAYRTSEPIDLLNSDTLRVVAGETPKMCFVYVNQKTMKK